MGINLKAPTPATRNKLSPLPGVLGTRSIGVKARVIGLPPPAYVYLPKNLASPSLIDSCGTISARRLFTRRSGECGGACLCLCKHHLPS